VILGGVGELVYSCALVGTLKELTRVGFYLYLPVFLPMTVCSPQILLHKYVLKICYNVLKVRNMYSKYIICIKN
jgi:hypothetical protein